MDSTKKKFTSSLLILALCVSLFTGTTLAWFTDSAVSSGNIIKAGNLDVKMYWTDELNGSNTIWNDVEGDTNTAMFNHNLWEPGYTDVRYIKIVNEGSLAFNYDIVLEPEGAVGKLAEVIQVYCSEDNEQNITDRSQLQNGFTSLGLLNRVLGGSTAAKGTLMASDQYNPGHNSSETIVTLALTMLTTAGNEYQGESVCDAGFKIKALATQCAAESDSFDTTYDEDAAPDQILTETSISAEVTTENGLLAEDVTIYGANGIQATIPEGVKLENDSVTELTLKITPLEQTASNITVVNSEVLIPVDVHIDGLAADNSVPVIIDLGPVMHKYLNVGNCTLYHVENSVNQTMTLVNSRAELTAHNTFTYNPLTGEVSMALASFSEVAMLADTENAWKGEFDYTWYDSSKTEFIIANADQLAGFGAIVGGMDGQTQNSFTGKTVKLAADINFGDSEAENKSNIIFYPIGYYNSEGTYEKTGTAITSGFKTFEGTFDGNGHTISNFYQNTWEMKGDHNWYDATLQYYRDGMGLFGKVYGGTVKNLTVDNFSSDGEITTTGVIAAYADCGAAFENIAITNCNPRVYNIGNGGIVGCVGWYANDSNRNEVINFKNITVDNSNKISALWESYDVACGGLVGQYYPTSGQSNAIDNAGIHFENCHVAAQMDVYNDVCGNYQYYAYRYAGMIIGSIRENTTNEDGKTIPDMTGISAIGCTVNYGDWNDYYYCEFEKNSLASYSEDYQFSRVPHSELEFTDSNGNGLVDANERASVTGCKHTHTDEENHQAIYLPFHQLFTGYSWGVSSIGLEKYGGIVTNLDITEGDQEESVEKFETKFTGNFLYRVGNQNAVSVGSLFAAKDGANISNSGVQVTINKIGENSNVGGTFTANTSDWTQGTIQFSGTGVVKLTIQDYNFCKPTELILEVVDAVNATSATSATNNNVVLLQDCGFSSLEVSGGYTLYGNGFTMTCGSDSAALDMGYSFVTLDSGTLDNVQIVCPNFDYAVLYKSNMTESGNRKETTDKTRYFNVKSGVMASGNSQILNSRISGGRAAVNVTGGNVVIDNSRIELGAVASVLVGAANSLTLRDVTLVQKPAASTYDSNKKLMGFSVLYLCDSEGKATPTTLEGRFIQQAWIDEDDAQYVPSVGKDIVTAVLKETDYLHDIDGDGTNESLNLGFAYMPEDATKTVAEPTNITDNRTDKATVPYEMKDVKVTLNILSTTVYVYSYKNTSGTDDSFTEEEVYKPNEQSDIITVTYSDTADGLTTGKSYGTDGWVYELNVDLDKLSGYALDFSKLSMSVNGVVVTDFKVNSSDKPTSPVAVTAGGTTYTLTATIDGKEYKATYKVTGTETSKESPSLVASNYEAGLCVASSYGGTWHGAAPALEGIQIKYWSVAEKQYKTINLSDYTPTTAGKQNGTNTTWTYSPDNGDFTLTLTGGQVHSGNSVNAMPVVCDGKLYFVAASSKGLVNSGNSARTIPVSYSFKDNNNGDVLTFSHTWSVAENKDEQYNYSDFCDGTMTKLSSSSGGGTCVTPDTLITLADGSQVRVDSLTGEEQLLVWNMETGSLDSAGIMFNDSEAEADVEVIKLTFSDGTVVDVIGEHGFWDYDLNRYVYLDNTAADYIGHWFAKQNGDTLEKVQLTDVVLETELTTAWSPVTEGHLCYFVNGMLSMPGGVGGLFNIFDVDAETMTYDFEAMAKDIETYGLFTYEELSQFAELSEDMFYNAGGPYLKVSMGKDNLTEEELIAMIQRYGKYFE